MSVFKKGTVDTEAPNPVEGSNELSWMKIAEGELGEKEISGSKHNPRILEYHSTTGGFSSDEVPWCASFVNWVMIKAGLKSRSSGGINWALAASWLKYGKACELKPGAIVVVSPTPGRFHVTFCYKVNADSFEGLGGNQSNACNIQTYAKHKVKGCRWPK